jgi:DNA-binding transcriptional LysR family regulator
MEPTPRAEGLHDAVRDVLVRIESTISTQPAFDPTSSDRSFTILLSDYTQLVLGPHLMALAAAARCTARFEFLPQVSNPQRVLERGEADLLIMPRYLLSPDHPLDVLYAENFVCVVWRDGSLASGEMSMQRYAAAGHVVMQPANAVGDSFEGWFLKRHGVDRRVVLTSYGFTALPALVCGTDLIATVHRRLARTVEGALPIVAHEPPLAFDAMEQAVQWHRYRTHDPGITWMRELMKQAVARMDAAFASR